MIEPLSEYENGIIIFDDILSTSNSNFFIRGRHDDLDVEYLSQSHSDLPKKTIRKTSKKNFLFNPTLKDRENIYRDVGGYDTSYDKFKHLCKKSWEEDLNYLCIDRSKKKEQGRFCICNENKNT